ncbi:MAG TPA: diguanylate cyclase, partial [Xanthomonadaceae bacterium]|nr:diguanylate cyclase [Xanthomonadaceae bacterium]
MNGTYNLWLVALSFAVASMASYVALDLASHVTASVGRTARNWLIGGALSMGLGIWSMHFIGMLAFRLPMAMSYSVAITGLSLLVAMLVSGFALRTVSRESLGLRQLANGAVLMGVGIASMHYVGMAAMQVAPPIRYDPLLFGLSIVIAIVASGAALWIAFSLRGETILSAFWRKGCSALVMGAAICGMHYTGMAAAIFSAGSMPTSSDSGISNLWLAATIASFSFVLLGTTLMVSMFDVRRARELDVLERSASALHASNDELEARVRQRTAELEGIQRGLTESKQRLEEAQKIARIGSWEWDVAADTILWSDEMHRIYGIAAGAVALNLETVLQHIHPDDRAPVKAAVGMSQRTGEPFAFEHRIVRPDGTIRTLQANGRVVVDDRGEVVRMLGTGQDVTEIKDTEQRLVKLAHFDPLTALPNRTLFNQLLVDALRQAVEKNWVLLVLFLDIDHFKNINDTMGHACGDELLRQVGNRLVRTLRARDTVGRFGGDEFAIILSNPHSADNASIAADKLLDSLREPYDLGAREVRVTASIGIAVFPADASDAGDLVKYADTAMYAAKEAGRDTYRYYTAAMNESAIRRLDLDNALRKALDDNEFVLHYQPKIDLVSGRWAGVEALLRWNRPGHGLVLPGEFIPLLEETGLIEPVGIWVIDTACRQIAAWIAAGVGPIRVAVNVSVAQMLHARSNHGDETLHESPMLEIAVKKALHDHGIAADLL